MAAREANIAAAALVRSASAVCLLAAEDFGSVVISEPVYVHQNGLNSYVLIAEPGVLRMTGRAAALGRAAAVGAAPGTPEALIDPNVRRRQLYERHDTVKRAIEYYNRPDETFVSIFKAYEVIQADLGGGQKGRNAAAALTGTDPAYIKHFEKNAHEPTLSGDRARHAATAHRASVHAPVIPFEEARSFVGHLLREWIDAHP